MRGFLAQVLQALSCEKIRLGDAGGVAHEFSLQAFEV